MANLKCLENFVPSEGNVYSEAEMRNINIKILKERGVSVDDIAQLSIKQSKYLDSLTIEEMRESVLEIWKKRSVSCDFIRGQIDVLAEKVC